MTSHLSMISFLLPLTSSPPPGTTLTSLLFALPSSSPTNYKGYPWNKRNDRHLHPGAAGPAQHDDRPGAPPEPPAGRGASDECVRAPAGHGPRFVPHGSRVRDGSDPGRDAPERDGRAAGAGANGGRRCGVNADCRGVPTAGGFDVLLASHGGDPLAPDAAAAAAVAAAAPGAVPVAPAEALPAAPAAAAAAVPARRVRFPQLRRAHAQQGPGRLPLRTGVPHVRGPHADRGQPLRGCVRPGRCADWRAGFEEGLLCGFGPEWMLIFEGGASSSSQAG